MIEGAVLVPALASSLASSSDVVIGLAIAIPVAGGGHRRGRGVAPAGPRGQGTCAARRGWPSTLPPTSNSTGVPTPPGPPRGHRAPAGPSGTSVVEIEERPAGAEPPRRASNRSTEAVPEPAPEPASYRSRLGKARGLFAGYLGAVRSKGKIDAATWDDLEEALIRADVGVGATDALLGDLKTRVKAGEIDGPSALIDTLKSDLVEMLTSTDGALAVPGATAGGYRRAAGVSGGEDGDGDWSTSGCSSGSTGWARRQRWARWPAGCRPSGTKVLLAAGDTFRAAAGEQLSMWASRADAEIVRGSEGGDPSSVVFDAVQRASARGYEVVLADTAGRLHNKVNLIEELKKIRRVADRPPGRVVEVLLVLDATTGQNGLAQAKVFLDAVDVSGVVLTKLDGTAKGGIVVAIQRELGLPVKLVGLGEGVDDLVDFDAQGFVEALF